VRTSRVEYGARSDEGFVGEADECGVELGICAEGGVVSGFGEGDASGSGEGGGRFACEIDDAEMRKALFALDEDQVGAEGSYAGEHDAGTVGNDFVPAGANGIAGGGVIRRKVRPASLVRMKKTPPAGSPELPG